jgi:galactokinase
MDQFVSVRGKKDHALLLDCRSLEYRHVPLPEDVRLVICNTMVRHNLSGGGYNQRRKECGTGMYFFAQRKPGVKALGDISVRDLQKWEAGMPQIVRKRSRHVITQDERVIEAVRALEEQDVSLFGIFMGESHASLRDDFEVSCDELDLMVELAVRVEGVYGARMTGGGFGGCTINLVNAEAVEAFQAKVASDYERATGRKLEVYVCAAADGVRRVM